MNKRTPLLVSNFKTLVSNGGYYVDKTMFIPLIEQDVNPYLFFLRPRRFGKSLHLSMLEHYYGVQYKEDFSALFGEFFIGEPKNTTSLSNSYYTLTFNFSAIETGSLEGLSTSFLKRILDGLIAFRKDHGILSDEEITSLANEKAPADLLTSFFGILQKRNFPGKIFLFIDEYDHFTNELFSFNPGWFAEIVTGNGWVRKFYEAIKIYMGEGIIDRFFATGVTPVTLDSMTSGFNVAKNITLDDKYHGMAGFSEAELRTMMADTLPEGSEPYLDALVDDMRAWYNGSMFSPVTNEKLYNPQMVINFMSYFREKKAYPESMADLNVSSDRKKIGIILEKCGDEAREIILKEVLEDGLIRERMTLMYNYDLPFTKTDAVSLLFYNGLLTLKSSFLGSYEYAIPNYVIKQLFWEYFREYFPANSGIVWDNSMIDRSIMQMSREGRIEALVEYVSSILERLSNRDLQNFNEKTLKMIFLTVLMPSSGYFITSEQENPAGYADLILKRTPQNPGHDDLLIELKYMKSGSEDDQAEVIESGKAQLKRYKESLLSSRNEKYKAWLVVITGKKATAVLEV